MACTRRTIFLLLVIHTIRDVHARVMTMHSYLACNLSPLMIYIRASKTMTSSPELPALSMQLHLRACHAPLDVQRKKTSFLYITAETKNRNIYMDIDTYVCMRGCICLRRYVYEYQKFGRCIDLYVCTCLCMYTCKCIAYTCSCIWKTYRFLVFCMKDVRWHHWKTSEFSLICLKDVLTNEKKKNN